MYISCTQMPQIIPLLTLMLVHTWYAESTPRGLDKNKVEVSNKEKLVLKELSGLEARNLR